MFRWLALLLVLSQPALAAELTLELPSGSRSWTTEQLLARPDVREVTIDNDTAYKHKTVYRAVPLASLLEGIRPGDHLQVVALDGFVAELAAAPLLATSGSRAWLAIEDPANPYNTYLHGGLPPGPIANPGAAALRAVVEPATADYLYFVARKDGTHQFSRTYGDHVRAVNRFQRNRP